MLYVQVIGFRVVGLELGPFEDDIGICQNPSSKWAYMREIRRVENPLERNLTMNWKLGSSGGIVVWGLGCRLLLGGSG